MTEIRAVDTLDASAKWKRFAREYQTKVFSVSSFAAKRQEILKHTRAGIVVDLGCGPLGLMLRDIALLAQTKVIGTDFCLDMITESRRKTNDLDLQYTVADNRYLPFSTSSIDTIVSVNSFVPETRAEVELIFDEVSRVLRKNGRLVAVLPSFEMSLVARDQWNMEIQLDIQDRREWDTQGWQCFYTTSDIERLMYDYHFSQYRLEKLVFSAAEEITHIVQIYADSLKGLPQNRLVQHPLFEHLLIADR